MYPGLRLPLFFCRGRGVRGEFFKIMSYFFLASKIVSNIPIRYFGGMNIWSIGFFGFLVRGTLFFWCQKFDLGGASLSRNYLCTPLEAFALFNDHPPYCRQSSAQRLRDGAHVDCGLLKCRPRSH